MTFIGGGRTAGGGGAAGGVFFVALRSVGLKKEVIAAEDALALDEDDVLEACKLLPSNVPAPSQPPSGMASPRHGSFRLLALYQLDNATEIASPFSLKQSAWNESSCLRYFSSNGEGLIGCPVGGVANESAPCINSENSASASASAALGKVNDFAMFVLVWFDEDDDEKEKEGSLQRGGQ